MGSRNIATIVGGIVGTIIGMCAIVDWVVKKLKVKKSKNRKAIFLIEVVGTRFIATPGYNKYKS